MSVEDPKRSSRTAHDAAHDPRAARAVDDDDVPFAPDAEWVREQRSSLQYAGVGVQFGLTLCAFALIGHWLDKRAGTEPWLLILGVLLGFGGGTYSLLKKFKPGAE